MKSVLIAKSIRKNLKYLRKYTKNSKNSKSETAAWICDNFYTAEQSGKSAAEFFKKRFRLSDEIFDICKKEIQEQQNDREQDIEKLLIKGLCSKSEWFDCQSLTALPAVLTALAIDLCKEGAQKNDPSKAAKGIELLARLRSVDFETIISRFSASEKIFSADPGGYYLKMTAETRAYYRRVCADRAAKRGIREEQFAKTILEKAKNETDPRKRHIGYHLIERSEQKRRLYTLGWVFVAARGGTALCHFRPYRDFNRSLVDRMVYIHSHSRAAATLLRAFFCPFKSSLLYAENRALRPYSQSRTNPCCRTLSPAFPKRCKKALRAYGGAFFGQRKPGTSAFAFWLI